MPQYGDNVIFDGTSSKNCSWDFIVTLSSLITNSGYSGIITLETDLSISGDVNISGGTLILNNGDLINEATPLLLPPDAASGPASNINGNSAVLNATVNPNGSETTAYFEWGTDISYGTSMPPQVIGNGNSGVSISELITGLSSNTTYHYRVVASNINGTAYGNDISFMAAPSAASNLTAAAMSSDRITLLWTDNSSNETGFKIERKSGIEGTFSQIEIIGTDITTYSDTGLTPETTYFYRIKAYNSIGDSEYSNEADATPTVLPIIVTTPATSITANTAILNGMINPHGSNTTNYFEWGTTESYGNATDVYSSGNGTVYIDAGDFLELLVPGVSYHFRLVASNTYGTAYGNDMTFTTVPGTDVSGYITTNTTWTLAGSPYVLTDNVFVYAVSNPTLTIEAGVEVRFMGNYTGIYIGNSWYQTGLLKAQGTASNPILFTSNNPNPAPGDWMFIKFEDNSMSESILEHVIVEYGGWWGSDGWTSIFVSDDAGGNLMINNSIIRYSKGSGIQLSSGSSITLTDSSVVDNEGNGVEGFGWGDADITGSAISGNGGSGVYAKAGAGSLNITSSTISNNGVHGINTEDGTTNTTVSFSMLEDNTQYAVVSGSSVLEISHSNISGNGNGISSYPDKISNARFNWWGNASGPSGEGHGTGQSVDTGINYEPWLGSPFSYPFYTVDLTATVQEFSPLNNSAGYNFSVSENADWLFTLKDSSGNAMKSFNGSGASGSLAWDGTDSGGVQVPDGTYIYRLDTTRVSDGFQAAPFIGDVIVGTGLPKAEIAYPEDGQFISGNNLLDIQGTAFDSEDFNSYKLEYNAGTAPWTWALIHSFTTPVNAGILGTWDLSSLTEPYYSIRLSVSDLAGNTATDTIEVKLFNIYNVAVSNTSFSPNGDGYRDGTSISGYLTYQATWVMDIRNPEGIVIRTFAGAEPDYYFSINWNGKDSSGIILPGGVYSYTITATEPVSGTISTVTGNITINLSLPVAITDPATNITASSASLNATVNPNESPTSVYFQWGTDILYGSSTSPQSAGSGTNNVSISTNLTGLTMGVIYHYRAAAVSVNGTSYGEDRVFKPNSATLTGAVTDSSTGLPVPYVNVSVTDLFGTYNAVTNQSGVYNLTQVTGGNFTAAFKKAGYTEQTVTDTLLDDQTMILDIQLTPVSPIFIDITSPADDAVTPSSPLTVAGKVHNAAGIGGPNEALAQSFMPETSGPLNKVSLLLNQVGSPTDNVYVRISGEFLNYPYETMAVSSAGFMDVDGWTFIFQNPPVLIGGETYFIELHREERDTNNYYVWLNTWDIFWDYYTDGAVFYRNNGTWEAYCSCDFTFRIYINNMLDALQLYNSEEKRLYGVDPYQVDVTVNGMPATIINNNAFSASIPLVEGPNTITAAAADQYTHAASDAVNVILSPSPAISDIAVTNITSDSAIITWTTDQQADSVVDYGATTAYGSSVSDPVLKVSHSITLTGLTPGMLYHFKVTSTNTYGSPSSSGDDTFTTISPSPPAISNIVVINITNSSAVITWTTDQQANSLVEYGTTDLYGNTASDPSITTNHSITLTNLGMGTTYHFRVISTNDYGLTSSSGDNIFTTTSPITITIVSPVDNDTINRPDVMVRGTVTNSTGNETGVTVNGMVATVYNGQFFVNHVPLTDGQNTITVNAVDTDGNTASHAILVNANTSMPHVSLIANIESGIAPLTSYFSVSTSIPNSVSSYSFDYEGDAVIDYTDSNFDDISVAYSTEGIYYPTVSVTDSQSNIYSDTIAIIVLNQNELDALLRAKWEGMRNALSSQDVEGAVGYFIEGSKDRYRPVFEALSPQLPVITGTFIEFNIIDVYENIAEYEVVANESGVLYSYPGMFIKDANGIWKFNDF